MRKIIFAAALLASTHAFAQNLQFMPMPRVITGGQQNGYDATERMNEQNRERWDQEEAYRNRVLQNGGTNGQGDPCRWNCGF